MPRLLEPRTWRGVPRSMCSLVYCKAIYRTSQNLHNRRMSNDRLSGYTHLDTDCRSPRLGAIARVLQAFLRFWRRQIAQNVLQSQSFGFGARQPAVKLHDPGALLESLCLIRGQCRLCDFHQTLTVTLSG